MAQDQDPNLAIDDVLDDESRPEDADDEAAFKGWWAHLPDFIKPGYPLDMPPARLPFVQHVFTAVGAMAHCPEQRCRRAQACRGLEGPACYRADRAALGEAMFLYWAMLFLDLAPAEYAAALRATGNRYAPGEPAALPPPSPQRRAAQRGR